MGQRCQVNFDTPNVGDGATVLLATGLEQQNSLRTIREPNR